MTFAPLTIREVRALLKGEDPDLDDAELGIVGGPSHIAVGTSYHLGEDQLIMSKNPYSARTVRDRAGLSNAASALDVDDELDELRELSVWCVAECRKGAPDTLDIREIIYSPDGINVYRWDRERGVTSLPVLDGDLSHRTHTHFSWYRDSEFHGKTALFKRFYSTRNGGTDMEQTEPLIAKTGNPAVMVGEVFADLSNLRNWLIDPPERQGFGGPPPGSRGDLLVQAAVRPPQPATVDPAALKAVLLDPAVLAAIAGAVVDEEHRRMAS